MKVRDLVRLLGLALLVLLPACGGGGGGGGGSKGGTQAKGKGMVWDQSSWDQRNWN